MKIIRYLNKIDNNNYIGIMIDDNVINFTEAYQAKQLIETGACSRPFTAPDEMMHEGLFSAEVFNSTIDFLNSHNMLSMFMADDYKILSPVANPSKILAMGRNYIAHAKELGNYVPEEPVFFSKLTSSIIGSEEPVIYKKHLTRVDPEVELAVVIGKCGCNIPEDEVWDYIAGYTIVNDVTARDMQSEDFKNANPWTRSKGIDTFCPVGPCIVLPDEIGQPVELDIEMRVNGEVRQKSNTSSFLFSIPRAVSYMSQYHTLYPGDIIPTGTPEGIAPVQPGDIMECYVEKIGILRNPVILEN